MDLDRQRRRPRIARFPRTRGDGPCSSATRRPTTTVSPHTRGWTQGRKGSAPAHPGFPAHAGMDPKSIPATRAPRRFPRTRGDGPAAASATAPAAATPRVSPHTRGWTRIDRRFMWIAWGFPAHAGMDPCSSGYFFTRSGFPAHAGMDLGAASMGSTTERFPRTRGDGPSRRRSRPMSAAVSPHTRGWTPHCLADKIAFTGFPAHAGMDPSPRVASWGAVWFPRTRGDGPHLLDARLRRVGVSPHTRGWTRPAPGGSVLDPGFPAHAGMDPAGAGPPQPPGWFPRTRGDGPWWARSASRP